MRFKHTKNIRSLYLKLLPIQIFVVLSSSLAGLVNGLIIGNNLSSNDLTALGLVTPVVTIISAVASIFSGGMGIICGNLMGKGDTKKIQSLLSSCINSLIGIGLLFSVICFVFASPIANLAGATVDTLTSTINYIQGLCIGIIPAMVMPTLMSYLQLCNESNFSLITAVSLAVLNFILDFISVNFLHNGVLGIGLASSISNYLDLLLVIVFIYKKKLLKYLPFKIDFKLIGKIVVYGLPFALSSFFYSIRNIFINNHAANIGGTLAVSALAILSSFGGFVDAFNIGIGGAYRMLVSVFIGERDSDSIKTLFRQALIIGELIILIKVLVMIFGGELIVTSFGATGEVVNMAKELTFYYALSSIPNILTVLIISTYVSLGKSNYCNFVYLINALVAPLVFMYSTSNSMGVYGIWRLYYVAEIVTLVLMYLVCAFKNKHLVWGLNKLLSLDENFDNVEKMSISINSIEEVVNTSINVEKFLKDNGIDERRSKLSGLCIEEMAGVIVNEGFGMDNKNHVIDILLIVDNEDITIRLRDDCVPFDQYKMNKIYNPDDPCKNVGMRIVKKISKKMNYQAMFGMNLLTIKL